jgi:hypothetical protein
MKTLPLNWRRGLLVAVASIGLFHSTYPISAVQFVYTLGGDWSDTQNPHGAWSYNYNNSPIAVHQTFWWGQAGWGTSSIGDGSILRGNPADGMTDPWGNTVPPAHDWQPGDVMMHALSIPYGGASTFLNVQWTSPMDGTIDILGRAWDGQIFSDRDVAWALIVGGEIVAQRSSTIGLYRTDAGAQFASNVTGGNSLQDIPVAQGDVVEFRVISQTYYGHFVGIEETITLTPVPEPGSASLGAAILGVFMLRRFALKSAKQARSSSRTFRINS